IALGTSTDSIKFTSNSASPSIGIWNSLYLNGGSMTSKFNYCSFKYAYKGILDSRSGSDTLILKNSNFTFNTYGLDGSATTYGVIDSSNFINNTDGAVTSGSTISYCNFLYNTQTGLSCTGISLVGNIINNCVLNHNQTGIGGKAFSMYNSTTNYNQSGISARGCRIYNCKSMYNQSGIGTGGTIHDDNVKVINTIVDSNTVVGISVNNRGDSIAFCEVNYNGIGLIDNNSDNAFPTYITKNNISDNSTGLQLVYTPDHITCNKICNNTTYDLTYSGASNFSIPNNYFCTSDSAFLETLVYDGYDNISYGLVNFMPFDSACAFTTTGIHEAESSFSFDLFPNPASDHLTLELPANISKTSIQIFNATGELEYSSTITNQRTDIDVSSFASGIYFIQISTGKSIANKKFIKQ
ncbi:MAG: T9SS type A sorting domain-containing protein, partial [Bacteroidia bacterium]